MDTLTDKLIDDMADLLNGRGRSAACGDPGIIFDMMAAELRESRRTMAKYKAALWQIAHSELSGVFCAEIAMETLGVE